MNYWFVVHDLKAYEKHGDLIGCKVKQSGVQEPSFTEFSEIRKGDKVVYYATGDHVIVGIFNVVSDMLYLPKDPYWKEIMVYRIEPAEMPAENCYVDFKKAMLSDWAVTFDLFRNKARWYDYIHGKTCRTLTEHDYRLIEGYLRNPKFLIKKQVFYSRGCL